ncbi:hypothetical protein G3580_11395 [Nitrogeniibacter mangrovi]|uniref:Uncharacterized protein n=1 Tax=Nitrogeniibacter mangrovi TaxID=2016596 RepID=A0A6C1B653_9RHOO|nr:hypothetical protein [Nitrogeniibacter mangrovi]QID18188.1 hypothetical protein G3580_11395 [Nitrogeniibacter mangrovi]
MSLLHPAAVLALWAGAAVLLQLLHPPALWWSIPGVVVLASVMAGERFFRLLRRIRILLLVTIVLFGLATPGVRLLPQWTWLALTWDGLALGAEHALRLVTMVSMVALLLTRMSNAQLVCALHAVFSTLRPLGVPAELIAVRLTLVLRAVESPRSGWRAWFLEAESAGTPGVIPVQIQAFRWPDGVALALLSLAVVLWGMW